MTKKEFMAWAKKQMTPQRLIILQEELCSMEAERYQEDPDMIKDVLMQGCIGWDMRSQKFTLEYVWEFFIEDVFLEEDGEAEKESKELFLELIGLKEEQ